MMRIAYITTWLQQCGIATYTENLASAVRAHGHDVVILAERDDNLRSDAQSDIGAISVRRCWNRDEGDFRSLIDNVKDLNPDVVHWQHEFGLCPHRRGAIKVIQEINKIAKFVITPHTITDRRIPSLAWFWPMLNQSRAHIVAHTSGGYGALCKEWRIAAHRITHIPHGTTSIQDCMPTNRLIAREKLGLPMEDRTVFLSLGFVGAGKRQHVTVTALHELVEEGLLCDDEVLFVIAGKPGGGWSNSGQYVCDLQQAIEKCGADKYVEVRLGFVPFDDMADWYGAADVIVNNSVPSAYSASGRIRLAAAYGTPQIVEDVEIHRDFSETGVALSFPYGDYDALKRHILNCVRNDTVLKELKKRSLEYAIETEWSKIAARHIALYGAMR